MLINKSRAKKGIIILTPIGGAIETTPEGNEYRAWFLSGKYRETEPSRKVYEELVDEEELLDRKELEGLQCKKVGYATELAETNRPGQERKMTLRLLEVFDAELNPKTLEKLVQQSKEPSATIRFVTEKEIRNSKTEDGVEIGTVAQSLLDIQESI